MILLIVFFVTAIGCIVLSFYTIHRIRVWREAEIAFQNALRELEPGHVDPEK